MTIEGDCHTRKGSMAIQEDYHCRGGTDYKVALLL